MQAVVSSRSSTLKSLISSSRSSTLKSLISSSTRVLQQAPPPSVTPLPWQKQQMNHICFLSSCLTTTTYHGTAHRHQPIMYTCSNREINMSSSNRGGCRTEEGKEEGEIIYHAKRIQHHHQQPERGILLCFNKHFCKTRLYHLQIEEHNGIPNGGVLVEHPFELDGKSNDFSLVGSCNGLICLTEPRDTWGEPMFVNNPVTTENVQLPEPHCDCDCDCDCGYGYENGKKLCYNVISGFGFDHVAKQYNILRIACDYHALDLLGFVNANWKVEILTLGSDAEWRMLGNVPYDLVRYYSNPEIYFSPLFFNGAIHWWGYDEEKKNVVAFDVVEEKFRRFPLPPVENYPALYQLLELGGYLCLNDMFEDRYEIWVMKEYGVASSWTKEYVIPLPTKSTKFHPFGPLMRSKNGNIVLLNFKSLVSYDPITNKIKELQVHNKEILEELCDNWVAASPHVSSFNSPNDIV